MSRQNGKSEKQAAKSSVENRQGAGSEYERERAGKVEGYGQPYPDNGAKN